MSRAHRRCRMLRFCQGRGGPFDSISQSQVRQTSFPRFRFSVALAISYFAAGAAESVTLARKELMSSPLKYCPLAAFISGMAAYGFE